MKFADKIRVTVKGGTGGKGAMSYAGARPEGEGAAPWPQARHAHDAVDDASTVTRGGKRKPDGGTGGRGGDVFIHVDPGVVSLKLPKRHYTGGNGRPGSRASVLGHERPHHHHRPRTLLGLRLLPCTRQETTAAGARAQTWSSTCRLAPL